MELQLQFPDPIGRVNVREQDDRWHWWPMDLPAEFRVYLQDLRAYDWEYVPGEHELTTDPSELWSLGFVAGSLLAIAVHLGNGQIQQAWRAWRRRIHKALPAGEAQEYFVGALEPAKKYYKTWLNGLILDIPGIRIKASEANDKLFFVEAKSSPAFHLQRLITFKDPSDAGSRWRVLIECCAFGGLPLPGADPVFEEQWNRYVVWAGAKG